MTILVEAKQSLNVEWNVNGSLIILYHLSNIVGTLYWESNFGGKNLFDIILIVEQCCVSSLDELFIHVLQNVQSVDQS